MTTKTKLGRTGPEVFPIALGCMGKSGMYGDADERESIATIHAALDAGVDLLDTGDFYGAGHNELLIGRAIRDRAATAQGAQASPAPEAEYRSRTRGPGTALGEMGVLGTLLYLKIREVDRRTK